MPSRAELPRVRKVVIVGGGTAGWITAGVLASRFPQRGEDGFAVTLIESRQQPPIGVGEGTWPTIRATLKQIRRFGLHGDGAAVAPESSRFLRATSAGMCASDAI